MFLDVLGHVGSKRCLVRCIKMVLQKFGLIYALPDEA